MSLHNLKTTVTPAEHTALFNAVTAIHRQVGEREQKALDERTELSSADRYLLRNCETALLWLNAVSEQLYEEWVALPAGSHLKEAYSDQVWTWSDRDLAAPRW